MRAGAYSMHHALTPDAAAVVKQALVLAKRRGHAQVTPLHVASTMLAASGGLFRIACQESHSHPLQCKALELCFNVALNRLPATSSNPILGPRNSQNYPSISNALVAAFKRAQAHQRRGSTEKQTQPQPILSVKIELEQLIVSILDDPSVSRVMREAGFSSTQVKTNVEKTVSLELCSRSSSPNNKAEINNSEPIKDEDVEIIIENLLSERKRKSLVVVGECISTLESTIKGVMNRIEKGTVPDALKEVKFIPVPPFYSFCNLYREEIEQKISELTCLVNSLIEKGVVLYLGDLKWISEYRIRLEQERSYYCSVEHMIMEIGKLVWRIGEIGRFWVIGISTFRTYIKCRDGYQSLETVWGLHPVTIPANSLGLSLGGEEVKLSCCNDSSGKYEEEARNFMTVSSLPSWLKDECNRRFSSNTDKKCESIGALWNNWNSFCYSAHRNPNLTQMKEIGDSSSSSSEIVMEMNYKQRFTEFTAENLNALCSALEKSVPACTEVIPQIAETILTCRSRKKEETWLLFVGPDNSTEKEKISRELAKIVFGSYSNFVSIEREYEMMKRIAEAVSENPHRVYFLQHFEETDNCLRMEIMTAMVRGCVRNGVSGEEVGFRDAIFVLSCEDFSDRNDRQPLDLNISHDDDLGILENVDTKVVFKFQDL